MSYEDDEIKGDDFDENSEELELSPDILDEAFDEDLSVDGIIEEEDDEAEIDLPSDDNMY